MKLLKLVKGVSVVVGLSCVSVLSASADKGRNAWNDLNTLQENREAAHCTMMPYAPTDSVKKYDGRGHDSSYCKLLNGEWKFRWCSKPAERVMDFYKSDFDDSKWEDITVPANWQMEGFGMPIYINTQYPFPRNQPHAPTNYNPVGAYRRSFTIPKRWEGRETFINFDGVESAFYIWVNGKRVGYSQGSRTPAQFNLTKYLKPGVNTLAVEVYSWCDGSYVECQDFWRLSGIFRDVTLVSRSKMYIRDYTVTQSLTANYKDAVLGLNVELANLSGSDQMKTIKYVLVDPATAKVVTTASKMVRAKAGKRAFVQFEQAVLKGLKPWTPETPKLYQLVITQIDNKTSKVESKLPQQVGFRTCEIKDGKFLLNGVAVLFRGANRHEHDQFRGHYILPTDMVKDIDLMVQYNFNAVRNCHYPNAPAWYELCAKKGLMVWDEANLESHGYGYGKASLAKNPKWQKTFVERNQRMVKRSKNCPAIVTWSLGNECGDGINMKAALDWIHKYDSTRPVHSERAMFGANTDIVGTMYPGPVGVANYADKAQKRPWIICEYTHAMGNSNGNIKEYWEVFNRDNHAQGGFVWDWIDQGLAQPVPASGKDSGVRPQRFIPVNEWNADSKTFFGYGGWFENKGRPHNGNFCMNGLVNADRSVHSGIYAMKKEQQFLKVKSFDSAAATITVHNCFHFTNPKGKYSGKWALVNASGKTVAKGTLGELDLKPNEMKSFKLDGYRGYKAKPTDELYLNVNFILNKATSSIPAGYQVAWAQFPVKVQPVKAALDTTSSSMPLTVTEADGVLKIFNRRFEIQFGQRSGAISKWNNCGVELIASPLLPNFWRAYNDNDKGANVQRRLAPWRAVPTVAANFTHRKAGNCVKVEVKYILDRKRGTVKCAYTISPMGEVQVDYAFVKGGSNLQIPRIGMSLAMPKSFDQVSWYGRGPHSTYNDRLQQPVGVYNTTVDKDWEEFSRPQEGGNKTELRWMKLTDKQGRGLAVYADAQYLQGSVCHYNARQVDSVKYSWQLQKEGKVWFNIDHAQMGLGGINSWGAWPLKQYQLTAKKYNYRFVLKPVVGK